MTLCHTLCSQTFSWYYCWNNTQQLKYNSKATEQKTIIQINLRLTRRTLRPVCSCTWHRRFCYPRRCHWCVVVLCSWGCSMGYYTWARAAHLSMRQISNTVTKLWWRCSKSPRTMLWWSQCTQRLRRKVTNILLLYVKKCCFICFRPLLLQNMRLKVCALTSKSQQSHGIT